MPGTFTVVRPPETSTSDSTTTLRSTRPTWRRWLIDVERGLMHGVRGDSIFFVYFFLTSADDCRLGRAGDRALAMDRRDPGLDGGPLGGDV